MFATLIEIGKSIVDNAPMLVGFILPPIVDWLNKDVKDPQERFLVVLLVCLITATVLEWNKLVYGSLDELVISAGVIFAQSQVVFKLYFKNSFLRSKLQEKLISEQTPTGTPSESI